MAKKKVIEEVVELEAYEGTRTFVATGKCKHLVKDVEYKLPYVLAVRFIELGYVSK